MRTKHEETLDQFVVYAVTAVLRRSDPGINAPTEQVLLASPDTVAGTGEWSHDIQLER